MHTSNYLRENLAQTFSKLRTSGKPRSRRVEYDSEIWVFRDVVFQDVGFQNACLVRPHAKPRPLRFGRDGAGASGNWEDPNGGFSEGGRVTDESSFRRSAHAGGHSGTQVLVIVQGKRKSPAGRGTTTTTTTTTIYTTTTTTTTAAAAAAAAATAAATTTTTTTTTTTMNNNSNSTNHTNINNTRGLPTASVRKSRIASWRGRNRYTLEKDVQAVLMKNTFRSLQEGM